MGSSVKTAIIMNNDNDDRRQLIERCTMKSKMVCNPIIDWTDQDVWDYIASEHVPVNPIYKCGYSRVGCIGCPMAGTEARQSEFAKYPKYRNLWILSFEHLLEERKRRGLPCDWKNGYEVFHWWMEDGILPGQTSLFGGEDD